MAKVMIVEDEEAVSLMLRYNLEAEGFEVEQAFRGDEADIRLKEITPDLLLLDWMLPGLSGIELCRRLRKVRRFCRGARLWLRSGRGAAALCGAACGGLIA